MSIEKIIVSIIGGIFQGLAATKILDIQIKLKTKHFKLTLIFLLSLYSFISLIFIPNQFRFIYFFFLTLITLRYFLKINYRKAILYAFVMMILIPASEIVISLGLVLCGISSKDIVNNNFYNLIVNVLVSLLSIGICYIPFFKSFLGKIIKIFDKNSNFIKYLYIFIITIYLVSLKNGFEFLLKSNYYINIFFIVGIVLILTLVIKNEFKYDQLKEQNKQMLNYVTKYEKIITDQGKANHEFKNQLMVIRGYAQMNSPKLIEYLDSITKDLNKTHSSYLISQLNNFPDGGIKGLLYYKLSTMDDEKIKYEINVESGAKTKLKSLNTDMYKNITKILGVLLDNAIDASKISKEKQIIISVTKEKSNIMFSIYNTYKGKLDLSKIGNGHTTKGKGHGYGLRLVKDIISENSLLNFNNYLEEEYFVSSLSIKIQNKIKKAKN